jgi:hypothetical protein
VRGLALAEHRRGVQEVAVRRSEHLRRAQEDGRAVLEGVAAHAGRAFSAASIAAVTSAVPAWWNVPSFRRRSCGATIASVFPVRISRPPATTDLDGLRGESREASLQAVFPDFPGRTPARAR